MSDETITDEYLDRLQAICDVERQSRTRKVTPPTAGGRSLAPTRMDEIADGVDILIAEVRRLRAQLAEAGKDGLAAGILIGAVAKDLRTGADLLEE